MKRYRRHDVTDVEFTEIAGKPGKSSPVRTPTPMEVSPRLKSWFKMTGRIFYYTALVASAVVSAGRTGQSIRGRGRTR